MFRVGSIGSCVPEDEVSQKAIFDPEASRYPYPQTPSSGFRCRSRSKGSAKGRDLKYLVSSDRLQIAVSDDGKSFTRTTYTAERVGQMRDYLPVCADVTMSSLSD